MQIIWFTAFCGCRKRNRKQHHAARLGGFSFSSWVGGSVTAPSANAAPCTSSFASQPLCPQPMTRISRRSTRHDYHLAQATNPDRRCNARCVRACRSVSHAPKTVANLPKRRLLHLVIGRPAPITTLRSLPLQCASSLPAPQQTHSKPIAPGFPEAA